MASARETGPVAAALTVGLRRLTWTGARHGMQGSNPWMIVAIVAVGARMLRRLAHSPPEVLYRTKVKGGDVFSITARPRER
jgi:hypothetical protein